MQETHTSGASESCFIEGLKIFEASFSLLTNESIMLFMKKQDAPLLKVILQKYLSNQSTIEEKIKVIEFLTSYARIENGAEHLNHENMLKNLAISSLMNLMNQVDFYVVEGE